MPWQRNSGAATKLSCKGEPELKKGPARVAALWPSAVSSEPAGRTVESALASQVGTSREASSAFHWAHDFSQAGPQFPP